MKDWFKQELKIGQKVLKLSTGRYSYHYQAEVVGFTAKMVKVKQLHTRNFSPSNVDPCNLIIIDDILKGIEDKKNAPDDDSTNNIIIKL